MTTNLYDIIIIGAGGAGLMAASIASKMGKKVLVLDHNTKIGTKILISGGGRCNFTNLNAHANNYLCQNPFFIKSALAKFSPYDFLELVQKHKIDYYDKGGGALFCKTSSSLILNMLLSEASTAEILHPIKILNISKKNNFIITTNISIFESKSLIVATGGLSIPKIGATGFGYEIAKSFGHSIIDTKPALDGFILEDSIKNNFSKLSGISSKVKINVLKKSFIDPILITHNGLSGPASLKASLYWQKQLPIIIDWIPDIDQAQNYKNQKIKLHEFLNSFLPKRLSELFIDIFNWPDINLNELSKIQFNEIINQLKNFQLYPKSTVGYSKAEVTSGGVDTKYLNSSTMQSTIVDNLFFIGEVVDVTGELGGYNFQWAWSSGYLAGLNA